MDYNCITHCGLRMVFMSAALLFLVVARPASADVNAFYTDFASSQADANTAGVAITTEDFAADSPLCPAFSVAGIVYMVDAHQGFFDSNNQQVGFTSGGDTIEKVA
jgi:hypothetical protein